MEKSRSCELEKRFQVMDEEFGFVKQGGNGTEQQGAPETNE